MRAPLLGLAASLVVLAPLAASQGEGTVLSPEANVLYPHAEDTDGQPGIDAYFLAPEPATAGFFTYGFFADVETEFAVQPPLAVGLLLDATQDVVVTWVVQSTHALQFRVTASLFANQTLLGTASEAKDAVANQVTTYELRFKPASDTVAFGQNLRLVVGGTTENPQVQVTQRLEACSVTLPIVGVLTGPPAPAANNTTDDPDGGDTPALGFALIASGVLLAAWVVDRQRRRRA